jgi:hypothetical protein
MEIDDDKLKVYEVLSNIAMKIIAFLAILTAFFIILCSILKNLANPYVSLPLTALDAILSGTMYQLVKHFFPQK